LATVDIQVIRRFVSPAVGDKLKNEPSVQ